MRKSLVLTAVAVAALAIGGCDYGTDQQGATNAPSDQNQVAGRDDRGAASNDDAAEERSDARDLVQDATKVVATMKQDPNVAQLLQQARGVFIVPEYGKGAAVIGARGGAGVLLAHGQNGTAGEWTGPTFYNVGTISLGPQVGGAGGAIAMLLMNQQAVDSFKQDNNFSLNADAGFTLADYNARAQGSAGKGDVILWSDMKGAFAGASLSVTDIALDDDENDAFYAQNTTPQQILSGSVESPQADGLQQALQG